MKIKNVSETELKEALAQTSALFDNNVDFNRFERHGKQFNVTLRVKNGNVKHGSTRGAQLGNGYLKGKTFPRHTFNACWHVHGTFFERLLEINPNAVITTMYATINKYGGNWVDRNIGSIMEPLLYSQACECGTDKPEQTIRGNNGEIVATVKTVNQNRLTSECWLVQFNGLSECDKCEVKNTSKCGGKRIRSTGKNELGYSVPI